MQSILNHYQLILGSGSPRREDLLIQSGIHPKEKRVSDADESFDENMPIIEVAAHLAEVKANAIIIKDEHELLLTADTIVVYKDEIFGKPADREAAIDTIMQLQGDTHTVISGVHLRTMAKQVTFTDTTEVTLAPMSREEVSYYVDEYQPLDKAGAYGIQDWLGICRVAKIHGSYTNVMGLPMCKVYDAVKEICA